MYRFKALSVGLFAASLLAFLPAGTTQAAPMFDPGLQAPSLVENVACRMVRTRDVTRGGRVIYTTRRVCTPVCRVVRERVRGPRGRVEVRTVRRCM